MNMSAIPLGLQEKEKQREISSLLGGISDDQFAMLNGLGRRITDYAADKHGSAGDDAIDETYGVSAVFDEAEEESHVC